MDRTIIVSTLEEAAREGYRQGWKEAWDTQRMVVEMVIADWQKHYGESGSVLAAKGILQAINMSEAKAREMMGTPTFTAAPVPVTPVQSEQYQ